mmetsp:Transcript_29196/g.79015  ORF Transcript_29196/g.79015 Transcript_29196/m.79015 type:complete len:476 (+) Transcript_29196:101-1528(+)
MKASVGFPQRRTRMTPLQERSTNVVTKHQTWSEIDKRNSKQSRRNHCPGYYEKRLTSPRMNQLARNVYAVDFFFMIVFFGISSIYILIIFEGNGKKLGMSQMGLGESGFVGKTAKSIGAIHPKQYFEESFQDAPQFLPLNEHEVTFSLAIALSEKELNMLSHHCKRWGIAAPISIAVWTNLSPEEVMETIQSFKYNQCEADQLTIATLSTNDEPSSALPSYPSYQLRNLAIQGIQTTHVISLDIQMWTSSDLYETLNTPSIVQQLAENPRLAIVLPAFEMDVTKCSSHQDCIRKVPLSFESLVIKLSQKEATIMDPLDFSRQGSTIYRSWVKQGYGNLFDIGCVSSSYYEPVLAVRYCESLPPFQEVLQVKKEKDGIIGKDDLKSTWLLHMLRLGYSLKQLGGAFVIDVPSEDDQPTRNIDSTRNGDDESFGSSLRKATRDYTRADFIEWLNHSIPDNRSVQKCDDFDLHEDKSA